MVRSLGHQESRQMWETSVIYAKCNFYFVEFEGMMDMPIANHSVCSSAQAARISDKRVSKKTNGPSLKGVLRSVNRTHTIIN